MAISAIELDGATFSELGIGLAALPFDNPKLHMHSLGEVVVIAGPNGAGKTRLLGLITSVASRVLSNAAVDSLREKRSQAVSQLDLMERSESKKDEQHKAQGTVAPDRPLETMQKQGMSHLRSEIRRLDLLLKGHAVFSSTHAGPIQVLNFVPGNPQLIDAAQWTDDRVRAHSAALTHGGSANAEVNSPAYARSILRGGVRSRGRRVGEISDGADEAAEAGLRGIVESLLGSSFHFDLDVHLNLQMGRIEGDSYTTELSKGQQILFQFACMLHAQGERLRESIILLDEPENHLHPAVLNEVVDRLRQSGGVGQVWVATHSVPLIAHLLATDPDCLWYAEDGRFTRAGRAPMRVLEGLMGGAEAAANLQALTRLPAEYAALRFLSECLIEPGVAGPDTSDPQTNQIAKILSSVHRTTGKPLRIIDFGAGVGRLLSTLVACGPTPHAKDLYDYLAFEPDGSKHADLQAEIAAAYGPESARRIFSDIRQLQTEIDEGTVDCIVMCNVLHEITPDDWLSIFSCDGPLLHTLSPDGYILFVEDYGISVGERAHRYGFLLLDSAELSTLFAVREADRSKRAFVRVTSTDPKYENRLVAHLVSKECTARVSTSTRHAAIKMLSERALGSVTSDLGDALSPRDSVTGRDYARNAQLFANASIWLRINGGNC